MSDYCFIYDFVNFGNFPETAWWAMHTRRAAHHIVGVLGS